MPKRKTNKNFDDQCLQLTSDNINMYVPWYIMAAYAYYVEDDPIISDQMFDRMAKQILIHYDDIEHMHKDILTKETLEAGTFLGDYPSRIKHAVDALRG